MKCRTVLPALIQIVALIDVPHKTVES